MLKPRGDRAGRTVCTISEGQTVSLDIIALPWPLAPDAAGVAGPDRPHAHRCIVCSGAYRCSGIDETGACVPVCPPCHWIELGRQIRMYQSVVKALSRRRQKIAEQTGGAACQSALANRGSGIPGLPGQRVITGLGRVFVLPGGSVDDAARRTNGLPAEHSSDRNDLEFTAEAASVAPLRSIKKRQAR